MVLILTNKEDITVDFIVKELQNRKIAYYRLNTEDIPNKIGVHFDLNNDKFKIIDKIKNITFDLNEINSVYYRRPLINDFSYIKNATLQEINYLKNENIFILEGIYKALRDKYWINNVYDIREAENKIYQLQIAAKIGFKIPFSTISNQGEKIMDITKKYKNDCIIKPIKSGNMKDLTHPKIIFTSKLNDGQLQDMERIESFPIFIQNNIHKKFDLRIIVIGNEVFTAKIDSQDNQDSIIDWRKGKHILKHSKYKLPYKIQEMCIELTKKLNLNYSAIDMILDNNDNYVFLEINPNGQWAWLEKRLEFPLSKKLVDLLVVNN